MGLGAFAGGIAKGINEYEDIQTKRKNRELAEKEMGLREKAAQRDETRFSNEQEDRAREQQWRAEKESLWRSIYPSKPETQETMQGPTDARDAMVANAPQNQALPTGQQLYTPQSTTAFTSPAQAGVNDPGFDPFSKENAPKLMQAIYGDFAVDAKYGKGDPSKLLAMRKYADQLEADGIKDAVMGFMFGGGDKSKLQGLAQKFGVDPGSLDIVPTKGKFGPSFAVVGTKGGQPMPPVDIMPVLASLGSAQDAMNAFKAQRDDQRQEAVAGAQIKHYDDTGRAALITAEARRTRAGAAGAGGDDGWDEAAVGKIIGKVTYKLPSQFAPMGKTAEDTWANARLQEIVGNALMRGQDPYKALALGRRVIEGVNAKVKLSPKSKLEQYDAERSALLESAMNPEPDTNAAPEKAPTATKPAPAPTANKAPAPAAALPAPVTREPTKEEIYRQKLDALNKAKGVGILPTPRGSGELKRLQQEVDDAYNNLYK